MLLDDEERELPAIQRGLADTCFEEAQYESGIDVLTGLCSPRYKPPPLHIRQLVYISLYPPPPPLQGSNSDANANDLPDAISTPQKIRIPKDDIWPKPTAREKALVLLRSYVNVNSPRSLMRAFPFYPYVKEDGTHDANPFGNENMDEKFHEDNTPIRDELLKFRSLKDCWECLKDGFVKRKQQDQALRSKRQTIQDNDVTEEPTLIGPYAWPILEWFISVFEKDQELQQQSTGVTISPLLLVQIPPPKIRQGPRIGLDVPVEILKECFVPPSYLDASDPSVDSIYFIPAKRTELGMRLLSLLFNLTLTNPPLLSPPQLTKCLAITLRNFELKSLNSFFMSLKLSQAAFKLNVLENLMTKNEERTKAPTTKARAKPRAKGVDQVRPETLPKESEPAREAYTIPSVERVTSLISSPPTHDQDAAKFGLMKYHIVSALFEARNNASLTAFDEAVETGYLKKCIEEGYGGSECVAKYRKITLDIVETWEKQIRE